ncbi:hypothetical protein EBR21_04890 [bacterium]|nr:hypothetical protein [bacterium]
MAKRNALVRVLMVLTTTFVMSHGVFEESAHAGSIVINVPPPKKLSYQEDGRTIELEMTKTDVEVSAALKTWLDRRFGSNRGDYPYMVDKQSNTVTVLVDRATGKFEVVPISELK